MHCWTLVPNILFSFESIFINKNNLFLCVYLNKDHIALQNELEAYICFYILGAIMKKGNLLIENCK